MEYLYFFPWNEPMTVTPVYRFKYDKSDRVVFVYRGKEYLHARGSKLSFIILTGKSDKIFNYDIKHGLLRKMMPPASNMELSGIT